MSHQLYFEKCIERWDEAIPLGNGRIGTLIWGGPKTLRFSLDRTDIWDRSVPLHTDRDDFTYAHLVELARKGETNAIRELFDAPYNYPTPTKLPVGKLLLSFKNTKNIVSRLDLETAEALVFAELESERIPIRALCHAESKSGMIWIGCKRDQVQIVLEYPQFGDVQDVEVQTYDPEHREISQGGLKKLHYPKVIRGSEGESPEILWFEQSVIEGYSFGVVVGIQEKDDATQIVYRIVTSTDGTAWIEDAKTQILQELLSGYDRNRKSHIIWWEKYWKKSGISLPDQMFEKNWYLTNYLFGSCSRKGEYPMPLQGVWTADDGNLPPWKGDYHHDLNTQLSYSHFYKANHMSEGESFLDFLWASMSAGKLFAKKFFGTEGMCLPGVMSIDGQPLGGWPMYSLSPIHQIWLCQSFEQYYRYTDDRDFLEKKAWVYFEETAKCITALLEERDGKYYLPVSSSPELHDDEKESWVTPNSNYDLALLRYLYETLVDFSKILENGQEEKWNRILEKLPELAINEHQVLMIAPDESLEESQRHLSNAMAICPLHLYDYESEKEIIDATVLDYERLGTGRWVGFSFAWMAHLYGIQGNGAGAYEQLRVFWDGFCSPNGFHLNGDYKGRGYSSFHYRPFTLESNMFAADALQEMLFQMKKDKLYLFPAIPDKWVDRELSFNGFCGYGGITVSAKWIPGKGCEVWIDASEDKKVQICIAGTWMGELSLKKKETVYAFYAQI